MTEQEMFDNLTLELNGHNPKLLVPMKTVDSNWQHLKQEHLEEISEPLKVVKIANCCFSIWHDSGHISAEYDVAYSSGQTIMNRRLNGSWDSSEAKTTTENHALDAVRTMVARLNHHITIRFSRMYEPTQVKQQVREINIIELSFKEEPLLAWFVVNNLIYTARLDEQASDRRRWFFNGRKKQTIEKFCDRCWEAI